MNKMQLIIVLIIIIDLVGIGVVIVGSASIEQILSLFLAQAISCGIGKHSFFITSVSAFRCAIPSLVSALCSV